MGESRQQANEVERPFKPIGNMTEADLNRLVPDWQERGIEYRTGEPQSTDVFDSEELGRMGLMGVELLKPDSSDS